MGTSFEGRNSWEAWKVAMSKDDLRHFLTSFVVRGGVVEIACNTLWFMQC